MLNAKFARDKLHYRSDPRLDVTTMYVDNRYDQREWYASSANRFSLRDWWSVGLSVDYQVNALDADLVDFVYPRRHCLLVAVATSVHLPRFKGQASVLGTFAGERTRVPGGAAGDKRECSPTVVVSWQPREGREFHARAFYKRIFRLPTLNDLYYTFIGNRLLNPERAVQWNVGATRGVTPAGGVLRRLEVQVDAYYNRVTDKIVAMPTSNQFRWTMVNLGVVDIRGADAAVVAAWRPGGAWHAESRLNYTFQRARDVTRASDSFHGDQIPYIPVHAGTLALGVGRGAWDLNYSFIYTGQRFNASANIPENREKPWYTSDVAISWSGRRARVTAEVNNLFNQQYEVVRCYPMPGAHLYLSASITI
jgi:outer membrane cobalamin receptor